ncbi:hypothetical protein NDN08_008298 [Rhodosorus marinus]|uniref:sn-1-specific diacylglycerol lipase n=1 Tax=Rhodosorus marinus TaxID=101924 RepID=A0AAV8V003_9RHOD|nr:hypothetical protein NDN08_008298 [Rhodosorus marinus]
MTSSGASGSKQRILDTADRMEGGYESISVEAPSASNVGTGKWLRNRKFIKVELKESLGLGVLTSSVSFLVGRALESYLFGGIAAGVTVVSWLSVRLFAERIDHEEIQRSLTQWDTAKNTMEAILDAIKETVDPFALKYNWLIYLALMRAAHKPILSNREGTIPGTRQADVKREELEDIMRYCRLSSAAYGPLLILLGMVSGSPTMSSKEIIKKHTFVKNKDFVSIELDGESILYPRHYIACDHEKKSIVLSVRGTFALSDVATDILCTSTPFLDGVAHDGIKTSANLLWSKRRDTIVKALKRYPDYSLVVTGHSLGAGISTLLAMKLLVEPRESTGLPPETKVKCYAFASPPVFSPVDKLPDVVKKSIVSIQVLDDVVPSLSLASVTSLFKKFHAIDALGYDFTKVMGLIADESLPQELADAMTTEPDASSSDFKQLYVLGRRLWFVSPKIVKDVDNSVTPRVLISEGMVSNHLCNAYENTLQAHLDGARSD